MNPIQSKIAKVVETYKEHFADEYHQFCNAMTDKRELQKNQFASTGGDSALGQLIREVPVTLDNLMQVKLDKEERKYYQSKLGAEWFARTFKEFSPAVKA